MASLEGGWHRDALGVGAATPSAASTNGGTKPVSKRAIVLNLVAGGLGTGIFSLPWSMAGASLLPGVAMTFGVVALNAWTIMILVEAADANQVFDFGSLLGLLPGRLLPGTLGRRLPPLGTFMQAFANAMVWVALMGSLVSYLIVIHDSAKPFVQHIGPLADERWPLVTIAAVAVLPLCFLDQEYLSCTSTVAFLVNVYLLVLLGALCGQRATGQGLPEGSCLLGLGKGSPAMLAALSQCIIIQMCVLPMYEQLQDRSPARFREALVAAFAILALVFSVFGSLGYLAFGPGVNSNVLLNLPETVFADAAQLGTIAVVAAVYPLMVIPMVAPVKNMRLRPARDALLNLHGDDEVSRRRKTIVTAATVGIVAFSYFGALQIESLGLVNVIDGSLCVAVFTALGPSLVGLLLLERKSTCWRICMFVLLAFGGVTSALGIALNDNYSPELGERCAVHAHQGSIAAAMPMAQP